MVNRCKTLFIICIQLKLANFSNFVQKKYQKFWEVGSPKFSASEASSLSCVKFAFTIPFPARHGVTVRRSNMRSNERTMITDT